MAGANSNTFQHVLEVASVAALSNVHVAELDFGARAWVDSVQTSFYLTDAPALVPNGTTIIGPAPGAAAGKASARWVIEQSGGGGGSLAIENNQVLVTPTRDALNFDNSFAVADDPGNLSTDVSLRTGEPYISQADWYIDPVAGDDTAAGTIGAPLKTLTEWASRMGQSTIQITMNVHVLSDLAADDMPMGPINVGVGGVLTIEATPIVVQSSTFSAVTTANPATNTPWSATAAAVNWGAVIEAGQRIRMTAGASADAIAWPMFDHGGGVSDFSWPMTADPTLGPYGQSQETLTANTFDVEQLVKLTNFSLWVYVVAGATFQIVDCDVGGASYSLDNISSQSSLYGCQLQGATSDVGAAYVNCGSTADVIQSNPSCVIFGGVVLGLVFVDLGGFFAVDFDFAIQGGNLQIFNAGSFSAGRLQIFNWPGGSEGIGGVQIWQFGTLTITEFVAGSKRVWGSSSAAGTCGFRVQDNGAVLYDTDDSGLTLVGALGAAGAVVLASDGIAFDYGALPIYLGLSSRARRVTADVPNATDNLLNANDLAFTVNADGEFFLTMSLTLTADSTGAIGFQLTAPGGPTGTFTAQYVSSIPTAGVFPINTRVNKTVGAGGELVGLLITGSFQAGTDAVVTFQFASVGAGTTTLNENSGLSVVRKDPDAQFAGMTIE